MGFRDSLPPSLQAIVQNGLLDRTFQEPLVPLFLYDRLAEIKPWGANIGAQSIMTRAGLIAVNANPITGSDASADAYGFEQYSVKMDQFGKSIDTNMAVSAMALASKFLEDNQILGINAAQTLNQVALNSLYGAYGEGTTWATAGSSSSTTLDVADASGFTQAAVAVATTGSNSGEGDTGEPVLQLVPVSGSTPLNVLINGVANTVTGATVTTGHTADTLTLGTGITATNGWSVVSSIGPVQYRPNARASANQVVAGDVATLSLFQSGVTRLRKMNVKPIGGAYTAHCGPETVDELFQDNNFLLAYRGRGDSPAYVNMTPGSPVGDNAEFMGRFSGIDWILNNVTPDVTNQANVVVHRPILAGQGALIKAPFENMGSLVSQLNAGSTVQVDMINGVARILRAPLDRLGQVLSSTWSWIGGYTVGTDLLTGDAAAYKRAVVLEHA